MEVDDAAAHEQRLESGARSLTSILAVGVAFLMPIAIAPSAADPFWSGRTALLIAAGSVGLTAFPILLRRRETRAVAIAAAAFLAAACLSTIFSSQPSMTVVGMHGWGSGLLFWAAAAGLWCLGACVPPQDRRLVLAGLLLGLGLSVVLSLLQALDLVREPVLVANGRVSAFTGNAGRFAVLAVGATAIGALAIRPSWHWASVALLGSAAAQLSGTRSALLMIVLLGAAAFVRTQGGRRLVAPAAIVGGMALGSLVGGFSDVSTATTRSVEVGSATAFESSTLQVRLHVWSFARKAIWRDPLVGSGPGRFREATSEDTTVEIAQIEGSSVLYADAHNVVVELLVTMGTLGAAAFVAWIFLALVRARGALLYFAIGSFAMSLVQPLDVAWAPVAFLALGASGSVAGLRLPRGGLALMAPIGVALGGALLVGDLALGHAIRAGSLRSAERADVLLRPFPESAMVMANVLDAQPNVPDAIVIEWREEALRRDRTDPRMALILALVERRVGRLEAAEGHYRLALRHHPWSVYALTQLAEIQIEQCRLDEAREMIERADEVGERSLDDLARGLSDARERCEGVDP